MSIAELYLDILRGFVMIQSLVFHAKRGPPASNSCSLHIPLWTFQWSCYCPGFKAIGKWHTLVSLFARFDSMWLFLYGYLKDWKYHQNLAVTAELGQQISAVSERISARGCASFVIRLRHFIAAHTWWMYGKNRYLIFMTFLTSMFIQLYLNYFN